MTFRSVGKHDQAMYTTFDTEFYQAILAFVVDGTIRVKARAEDGIDAAQCHSASRSRSMERELMQ